MRRAPHPVRRRRARAGAFPLALASALALGGCRGAGVQSVLEARGPLAARTEGLWWAMFWTATAVYAITVLAMLWAAWRGHARRAPLAEPAAQPPMRRGVTIGAALTLGILLVFFLADLSVGRTLSPAPRRPAVVIEVVGHQWWWEVHYADTAAHNRVTDANEIHVPVGEPVLLTLTAQDVIHSIWVPNLAGKKDLIPGYTQSIWFQADTPGVYRGQCAEFCGHQHAKMALWVVAEPRERFAEWLQHARSPAIEPTDSIGKYGKTVFLTHACVMCHNIDGIPAGSNNGPDLTHVGSRLTIAAGTLPNTRGNLAGWVVDPQRIKPGNHMPPNELDPKDLEALLTYLQGLR